MEKKKVDFGFCQDYVVRTDNNGNEIQIKKRIPYKEKENFALELAGGSIVKDGECGVVYQSYRHHMIKGYLFAKYYTNIDVEDVNDDNGYIAVYDYLVQNYLIPVGTEQDAETFDDLTIVEDMYCQIYAASREIEREKNSQAYKVKTSFAAILNDEDQTESLSKAQVVNEQMIDILGAYMRETSKQNRIAPVRVGNNTINFSKKKK